MKTSGILFFLFLLILAGCNKDSAPILPALPGDKNTSEGSSVISDQTFEVLNGVANSVFTSSGLKGGTLTCPTISATVTTTLPILVTMDWGTGCASTVDGVTRSGKITASLSGLMNVVGSVATFSFADFKNDGNKITGTHRITYKGLNGSNWPKYEIFTEARIEFPDAKFITYRATYTRFQSEGSATATLDDDVWRIEGSSSGVSREGKAWTASFPSALVKKNSCKWFSSGSVLVTPAGELPRTINFGDGTCDNKATLTIGDKTTEITL